MEKEKAQRIAAEIRASVRLIVTTGWRNTQVCIQTNQKTQGTRKREQPSEKALGRGHAGQSDSKGYHLRKLLSSPKRKTEVYAAVEKFKVSERRACKLIGQNHTSQRYSKKQLPDKDEITKQIVELVRTYGRFDYRMITAMLRRRGYHINYQRVYRIWRTLGFKVSQRQPKHRRLWINEAVSFTCMWSMSTRFETMIM